MIIRMTKNNRETSKWIQVAVIISDWTLYALSAFAGIILFIDLIWGLDSVPLIKDRLPILTLIALATFFVNSIFERKTKIESIERQLEFAIHEIDNSKGELLKMITKEHSLPSEIQKFYRSLRREFPLVDFLETAQNEIFMVGTTLYHLIERIKPMLITKSKYCNVHILVLNPSRKNKALIDGVATLFGEEDAFSGELRKSCVRLLKIQDELRQLGGNISIRMHSSVPTVNLVMVDPDRPTGAIQVEILPYKGSANMRPGFLLRPQGENIELYELFRVQYKLLWDEAEELADEKV